MDLFAWEIILTWRYFLASDEGLSDSLLEERDYFERQQILLLLEKAVFEVAHIMLTRP